MPHSNIQCRGFIPAVNGRFPPRLSEMKPKPAASPSGFSLVEVMVSVSLMGMLTLAILTSHVFLARGERSLTNYGDMNGQARKCLDQLGRDLRSATDVTDFTTTYVSLVVPTNQTATTTQPVLWSYNPTSRTLVRQDSVNSVIMARDVDTLTFYFCDGNNAQTTSLVTVKQVQLSMRLLRLVAGTITSEYVISAQFTMRAKSTAH